MKIVHYHTRFVLADGGVVRAALDLTAALAARGHEVVILTHTDPDIPADWRTGAPGKPRVVTIEAPRTTHGLLSPAAMSALEGAIRGANALHLHTPWEPSNVQVAKAARKLGTAYVVSIHGMLDDWCMTQNAFKKRVYHFLAGKRLLERAAFVHCTAQAELDQARKWFPRGQGRVIPLVFDLAPYQQLPGPELARSKHPSLATDRPKLLFLSRVHPKKGIELLIDSLPLLKRADVDPVVSIAGAGEPAYVESLKARAASLGLADQVAFLGMVTGPEKLSVYQAADLFVLPTSQENFGFVLPEALACRTPVITTKGVDIWPELLDSGGAAIIDPRPDAIAETCRTLLADRSRRDSMGEKGREWVFRELDGQRVVERYEAMYAEARPKP